MLYRDIEDRWLGQLLTIAAAGATDLAASVQLVVGASESEAERAPLSAAEIAAFKRDGYLLLPGFLDAPSVGAFRRMCASKLL